MESIHLIAGRPVYCQVTQLIWASEYIPICLGWWAIDSLGSSLLLFPGAMINLQGGLGLLLLGLGAGCEHLL